MTTNHFSPPTVKKLYFSCYRSKVLGQDNDNGNDNPSKRDYIDNNNDNDNDYDNDNDNSNDNDKVYIEQASCMNFGQSKTITNQVLQKSSSDRRQPVAFCY